MKKSGGKGGKNALPHRVGDKVMAKFPGASTLWYTAEITNNLGVYKVQFEDGTKHELAPNAVQSMEAFRAKSPNRSKSPGRPSSKKSPARRSPARSPARKRSVSPSRSPSRARRTSPGRSPGRARAAAAKKTEEAPGPSTTVRQSDRVRKIEERNNVAAVAAAIATERVEAVDGDRDGVRRRLRDGANARGSRSPAHAVAIETVRVAAVAAPGLMLGGENNLLGDGVEHRHVPRIGVRHFGGGIGTFFLTLLAPAFLVAVSLICTKKKCTVREFPEIPKELCKYMDGMAIAIYTGWVLFQALLKMIPIGRRVKGQTLSDGSSLTYRLNGFLSFLLSMAAIAGIFYYRMDWLDVVYSRIFPMTIWSIVFSLIMSVGLYLKSLRAPEHHLSEAASGSFPYAFFMGRELNPRPLGFDLKMFLEMRPGLIGWVALNVIFVLKDYQSHGVLNYNLLLLVLMQTVYVADALFFEESILTTMDITTEGLGFMLTFGNLAFVPFIFSLPGRYLLEHGTRYRWEYLAALAVLNLIGYIIFRGSNSQKDRFRRNPLDIHVSHYATIKTHRDKDLLAGGYWGWLRHPNYLGDIIMALSWSLLTGYTNALPYLYLAYLVVLLVHRSIRDDDVCSRKYGRAWEEYRRQVPSRIFPKIF